MASPNKPLENKIWLVLSYWINFETWFSYERDPRLDKILAEAQDIPATITKELGKYEMGIV